MEEESALKNLKQLLEDEQWSQAEMVVRENKDKVKENWAFEVMPAICNSLRTKPNEQLKELLIAVCQEARPMESLIILLENLHNEDGTSDSPYAISLLPALETILRQNLSLKNFEWGLGEAQTINILQSQGFYRNCDDFDINKPNRKATSMLLNSMDFFKIYAKFLDSLLHHKADISFKRVVVHYMTLSLEHPLAHLDLDIDDTMPYLFAKKILNEYLPSVSVQMMSLFENYPPHKLFEYKNIEVQNEYKKPKNAHNLMDYPTPIGMGTLAYLIFCKNVTSLPLIYTHKYLLEKTMPFILQLLEQKDVYSQMKGLDLGIHFLTARIQPDSLTVDILDKDDFFKLPKLLFNTIRYCPVEMLRDKARKLLISYFNSLQKKSRLHLFMYLYRSCEDGPKGFLIQSYKDGFHQEFLNPNPKEEVFTEKENFKKFLMMTLYMPDLSESRLLDISDWLMGILNFMMYLYLNKLNPMKDLVSDPEYSKLQEDFMVKVEKLVRDTKDKFKAQVTCLPEGDKTPNAMEIRSALTYIDLIDSIFTKVQTLINEK